MNSIFTVEYPTLASMSTDDFLGWIQAQGLQQMPPVVQMLVEKLGEAEQQVCDFDKLCDNHIGRKNALASQAQKLIDKIRLAGTATDNGIVFTEQEAEEIRSDAEALACAIDDFDIYELFESSR